MKQAYSERKIMGNEISKMESLSQVLLLVFHRQFLLKKKNADTIRFCVDYSKWLNPVTN